MGPNLKDFLEGLLRRGDLDTQARVHRGKMLGNHRVKVTEIRVMLLQKARGPQKLGVARRGPPGRLQASGPCCHLDPRLPAFRTERQCVCCLRPFAFSASLGWPGEAQRGCVGWEAGWWDKVLRRAGSDTCPTIRHAVQTGVQS